MDSPNHLTRGGLTPAKIVNLTTGKSIPCMFNPYEYTLTKQNSWKPQTGKGKNAPQVSFERGGSQVLKLTLYFDTVMEKKTQEKVGDVREYTDLLWELMKVEQSKANPDTGKSQPPEVAFEWGRLYFRAVITTMSQKFTLFDPDGTPVRCQVDITLEQFIDVDDYDKSASVSSLGKAQRKTLAKAGERPDHIANREAGSPDKSREIMDKNNIDDPHNIPTGKNLKV